MRRNIKQTSCEHTRASLESSPGRPRPPPAQPRIPNRPSTPCFLLHPPPLPPYSYPYLVRTALHRRLRRKQKWWWCCRLPRSSSRRFRIGIETAASHPSPRHLFLYHRSGHLPPPIDPLLRWYCWCCEICGMVAVAPLALGACRCCISFPRPCSRGRVTRNILIIGTKKVLVSAG